MFDYLTELNYGTSTPLSIHDKKIRVKLAKKEQITEDTANRSYV